MDFFPFGAGVDGESGGVVPNNAPFAVAAGVRLRSRGRPLVSGPGEGLLVESAEPPDGEARAAPCTPRP